MIDLNNNDMLSKLKAADEQELMNKIIHSPFIYRDYLGLPNNLTFGLEIEYEGLDDNAIEDVKKFLKENISNWIHCSDGSLSDGGEIISPILIDKKKYWEQLRKICNFLKAKNVNVKNNAGAHVHIGANVIGDNYIKWIEFVKLYMYYENIIYWYSYGEELHGRVGIKDYAKPIASRLCEEFYLFGSPNSLKNFFYNKIPSSRHYSVNLKNINLDKISKIENGNTIEFRSPNGTINEKIWQNNVNTFAKILLAVVNNKVDMEYIDYRIKKDFSKFDDYGYYNEIYLEKALEFVDIVFDNNMDKIMFLKQYLKKFDIINDNSYVKM